MWKFLSPFLCDTTRDFSNSDVVMCAPSNCPLKLKNISIYLPKRLLLSFLNVLALPKASNTGFASIRIRLIFSVINPEIEMALIYSSRILQLSVLPAPLVVVIMFGQNDEYSKYVHTQMLQ